jgi:hypothetical protein
VPRELTYLTPAAILTLATSLLGVVFLLDETALFSVGSSGSGTTIPLGSVLDFGALVGITGTLGVVEIVLWSNVFATLSEVDGAFSLPRTLAIVTFFGAVLVLVGFGFFISDVYGAIQCAGIGHPLTTTCVSAEGFGAVIAYLILGGIIVFIGFLGILLGIWRLGTWYDAAVFKVGAILLIFPFLSVVGAILILVGIRQERERFKRGSDRELLSRLAP